MLDIFARVWYTLKCKGYLTFRKVKLTGTEQIIFMLCVYEECIFMRFIRWIKSTRVKYLFLIEVALVGVVSIINLLLNREGAANAIAGIIGETNYSSAIFIVGAVISALVMLAVVAFGLSIILYFCLAAMGKGTKISNCIGVSVRMLFFTFVMGLVDLLAFVTVKQKLISYGAVYGILGYLPFYLSIFLLSYKVAGERFSLSKKQNTVLSVISFAASILLTYPL